MPGKSYKYKQMFPDLEKGLDRTIKKVEKLETLIRKTQTIPSSGAGLKKTNQIYEESARIQTEILSISKLQKQKIKELNTERKKEARLLERKVKLEQKEKDLLNLKIQTQKQELVLKKKLIRDQARLNAQQNLGIKTTGGLTGALNKLTGQVTQLVKGFGLMALAWAGFRIGKEAVQLAGQLEGVKAAFDNLNDIRLLDSLREATQGTVTDLDLMKAAVQAKNFKIPLGQLATFFEFATKRAAQTGESVDFLVDSIIKGMGRKSVLILDNLGISSIELQKEVKKTGDFAEAAGNIIRRELGSMGEVALTAGQKMTQLKTDTENLKIGIGKGLIPVILYFGEIVRGIITDIKIAGDDIRAIATAFDGLKESTGTVNPKMEQFKDILKKLISPLKAAWEWSIKLLGAYRNVLDTLGLLNEETEENIESFFKWNESFVPIIEKTKKLTDEQLKLLEALKKSKEEYTEWLRTLGGKEGKGFQEVISSAEIKASTEAIINFGDSLKKLKEPEGGEAPSLLESIFGTDADLKTVQKRFEILSATTTNFITTFDNLKDRSLKQDKRRKIVQKGLDITSAVINTAGAVVGVINDTKGGLLSRILAGVSIGLFGASQVAKIASANYYKGTEYLEFGNYKKGRDTIPFMGADGSINMLNGGERIVDTKTNAELGGISNPMLSTAVNYYKNSFKNNNRKVEMLLSEQNGILRNTKQIIQKDNVLYVVKDGKLTGEKYYV